MLCRVYWISEYSLARIIYLPLVLCRVYWISEYCWARIIYRVNLLKLNTEKCSAKTLTKSFKFLECHMILYTWDKLSLIRPFNSSIHLFLILLLIYSSIPLLIYLSIDLFIHSSFHLFIYFYIPLFLHSFIPLFHHSSIHLFIYLFIYSFIY